jgi:hypothetical protein
MRINVFCVKCGEVEFVGGMKDETHERDLSVNGNVHNVIPKYLETLAFQYVGSSTAFSLSSLGGTPLGSEEIDIRENIIEKVSRTSHTVCRNLICMEHAESTWTVTVTPEEPNPCA